jgi:alpha-galactosidase
MTKSPPILAFIATLLAVPSTPAVSVAPEELAEASQWVGARFDGFAQSRPAGPALVVLANHDPVQLNGRDGKPLRIGDKAFTRGLFCHAPSRILVRLPGPAETFNATVGLDLNEQTRGGQGSVDFSVSVSSAEKFRSGVMRKDTPGKAVSVDLGGATEFVLQVDETPDGIGWDQSDWADAKVRLKDGRELWLADLPLHDHRARRLFSTALPFSFVFDGKPSSEVLKGWETNRAARKLDAQRTEHALTATDPKTGLVRRCVAIEYHDFPTVEWTLYFKNTGTNDSPIIEKIQALDITLDRGDTGEFLLHHAVGSPANGNDYGPVETTLAPKSTKRIGGAGGRPTNSDWSYFNLEWPSEGLILAVGWPGQWSAEFARDEQRGLHIRAGQELTHFKLLPGEEVRTPLIVLQFWKALPAPQSDAVRLAGGGQGRQAGDWLRAQNVWRRWMMAHSMPKPGGHLPSPQLVASSSRQYDEMIKANEENQIMFINRYLEEGLKLDYWWMDAGWYVHHGGGWPRVGTWEVDATRFPRGLRAVSDHAHGKGMKILVWFEPERVTADTWLAKNHPEWIFGGAQGGLLNLGNDDARRWLTEHVDKLITEQGIDLYRQDLNMDPLGHWRGADAPDRQGITEIRYVTGFLAYWDELRRRHPNLLIDSCASGGRRNDLETMRRAVPLWRSDYAYEAVGHQCMTYGISLWLPYHGTGTVATRNAPYYGSGFTPVEPYAFWSNVSPSLGCGFDMRVKELDYAALRRLVGQWRQINANYYGDFWPLTPWTRDTSAWMAWQFDRPEAGEGMVQAFRRHDSFYQAARLKLRGLEPEARYRVANFDTAAEQVMSGRELLDKGLPVAISEQPGAANFSYRKVN